MEFFCVSICENVEMCGQIWFMSEIFSITKRHDVSDEAISIHLKININLARMIAFLFTDSWITDNESCSFPRLYWFFTCEQCDLMLKKKIKRENDEIHMCHVESRTTHVTKNLIRFRELLTKKTKNPHISYNLHAMSTGF